MKRRIVVAFMASVTYSLAPGVAPANPAGNDSPPRHAVVSSAKVDKHEVEARAKEESLVEARQAGQAKDVLDKISATPLGSGCWVWKVSITYLNYLNQRLFAYFNETHWCGDGYWVYGSWFRTFGETYHPGWRYNVESSNRDSYSLYGDGWNVYLTGGTGHFCYVRYSSCESHRQPWMEVYVGGGGERYYKYWRS